MKSLAQLTADKAAVALKAKTKLDAVMRAAQEHVVTPATATAPAVTGREWTAEERAELEAIAVEGRAILAQIATVQGDANLMAEFDRITAGMNDSSARHPERPRDTRSIGQQFLGDPAVRAFLERRGHQVQKGMQFTSPGVELPMATLLDSSGGSGGPLIHPDYRPGVLPILFRNPVVADLIAPGTTDSNLISYLKELVATNAAAAVAEGAQKPESALTFVATSDPVVKIATWIPATTEAMDDIPALSSMIDNRLRTFLALAEDDQLLNGSGVAPNMRGIRNRAALAAAVVRGADTIMDAMARQISAIFTNAFIQPDGWVMNPADWLTVQLSKDAGDDYYGTGPFASLQAPVLWGLPGAITVAEPAGEALVGAFRTCAQFFRRGGVQLAMSNSHLDYFTTNKVAILIEERGALAVYREAAFGKVTGLNAA